ncbi:MAG: MBL fold metallo-hydrolase [Eubacteriales bacterium]
MQIDELTVGIVQTCCYILSREDGQECIVIDPGAEAARIRKAAGEKKIAAILLTHGHFDHIGAVRELYEDSELSLRRGDPSAPLRSVQDDKATNPRIIIHALDAPMLTDPELNAGKGLLGRSITAPEATDLVKEGDELDLAGLKVKVLHTPGHTPGSVCYLIEDELFTGDTMFEYGWGRTDLPGGNEEQMMRSLQRLVPIVREKGMHAGH